MDLKKFNEEAGLRKKANKSVFKRLKTVKPKQLDRLFHEFHEEVFEEIDCLDCANCCKTTGPLFREADIDRLARHFRITAGEFMDRYLRLDEDGDYVLQSVPCPFLGEDNYCSVYESRPKACREYPHTNRNKMHQILNLTEKNALMCPAVARIIDRLEPHV